MNSKKKILLAGVYLSVVVFPAIVFAQGLDEQIVGQINAGAESGGLGTAIDPRITVATLLEYFLGFLGMVFFVLMIVSAYWFVTARGNEEKEAKALDTIRRAVLGLVIVLVSYGIVALVNSRVMDVVR